MIWKLITLDPSTVMAATPDHCHISKRSEYRPNWLTQCFTQFKSPAIKTLFVLYLHYNVAFTFK